MGMEMNIRIDLAAFYDFNVIPNECRHERGPRRGSGKFSNVGTTGRIRGYDPHVGRKKLAGQGDLTLDVTRISRVIT